MGLFARVFGGSGGPPPENPKIPEALSGKGAYSLPVVGESHYQDALNQVCGGRTEDGHDREVTATLVLDDGNEYDELAVRVDVRGRTIGYLSRDKARTYRDRLRELRVTLPAADCPARIRGGWSREGGDDGHYGVRLDLRLSRKRR